MDTSTKLVLGKEDIIAHCKVPMCRYVLDNFSKLVSLGIMISNYLKDNSIAFHLLMQINPIST
jgi:hypothetical protein